MEGTVAELFPSPSVTALPVQRYALWKATQITDPVSKPPYFCQNSSYPTSLREKVTLFCLFPCQGFCCHVFLTHPPPLHSLYLFCFVGDIL